VSSSATPPRPPLRTHAPAGTEVDELDRASNWTALRGALSGDGGGGDALKYLVIAIHYLVLFTRSRSSSLSALLLYEWLPTLDQGYHDSVDDSGPFTDRGAHTLHRRGSSSC
jgi:hypothetical protein